LTLLVGLVVVAIIGAQRLPQHPSTTPVGLRGHTAPIGGPACWITMAGGHAQRAPLRHLGKESANGDTLPSTNDGVLHELDPRTGRDAWTFDSGNHDGTDQSVSPAVAPSGVIVGPAPVQ
jgi:hypothetical protein